MKIAFLEPLGVSADALDAMVRTAIGPDHEVVYWPDRKTDTETLVRRCEGADAVVLSNFPFRREVIERCPTLKYVCGSSRRPAIPMPWRSSTTAIPG